MHRAHRRLAAARQRASLTHRPTVQHILVLAHFITARINIGLQVRHKLPKKGALERALALKQHAGARTGDPRQAAVHVDRISGGGRRQVLAILVSGRPPLVPATHPTLLPAAEP
eukprot:4453147-Prymnesium_polylepis.1